MKNDDLSNRMKRYEKVFNYVLTDRLPVLIRLDGKCFHSFVKKQKCEKPFDVCLLDTMIFATQCLCEEVSGCVLGYTQSDEISLLLRNDQSINTQPWFNNELQKIVSISTSIVTNAFNYSFFENSKPKYKDLARFDARVWVMPNASEVCNYFVWRQQDASRNSISMLTRSLYSHNECKNKNCKDMQDMCIAKGKNWNDIETRYKRGACLVKKPQTFINKVTNEEVIRMKWEVDREIPIFTKDRDYVLDLLKVKEDNDN